MQSIENTASLQESNACRNTSGIFSRGDVTSSAVSAFFNESACRQWIIKRLHPDGACCPDCGKGLSEKSLNRFWSAERVKCCGCGKFFTALTGTFLSGCQLTFSEVIVLAILLSPDFNDKKIAEILDMSPANVRIWRNKFEAMDKLKHG